MNKHLEDVLKRVFAKIDNRHVKITTLDFVKTDVDYLINNDYLKLTDDASCTDGEFIYLVEATD